MDHQSHHHFSIMKTISIVSRSSVLNKRRGMEVLGNCLLIIKTHFSDPSHIRGSSVFGRWRRRIPNEEEQERSRILRAARLQYLRSRAKLWTIAMGGTIGFRCTSLGLHAYFWPCTRADTTPGHTQLGLAGIKWISTGKLRSVILIDKLVELYDLDFHKLVHLCVHLNWIPSATRGVFRVFYLRWY